jgi:catechol 2,3-dioxygenase-like lactoylglutathione lyase family enzyme
MFPRSAVLRRRRTLKALPGHTRAGSAVEDGWMSNPSRVLHLRVVVEADDYDDAVRFFRDALGLPELLAFAEGGDDRVAILEAGRATLELASPAHRVAIDQLETGGTVSAPRIRLAFEVDDVASTTDRLVDAGAELLAAPVLTPWRSINARLAAPADLQITVFQETETSHERASRPGFDRDGTRG